LRPNQIHARRSGVPPQYHQHRHHQVRDPTNCHGTKYIFAFSPAQGAAKGFPAKPFDRTSPAPGGFFIHANTFGGFLWAGPFRARQPFFVRVSQQWKIFYQDPRVPIAGAQLPQPNSATGTGPPDRGVPAPSFRFPTNFPATPKVTGVPGGERPYLPYDKKRIRLFFENGRLARFDKRLS